MHSILRFAETAYIETHTLLPLLQDYQNPRDYLSRLVKKGDLIRLRNGFYLVAEKIEKSPVPFEQIANLLHGPSYLSFEWALAYYGMIPEGVYVVTSASMVRAKSYKTAVGTFEYTYLSRQRYAIGIDQQENATGKFLIATPEKALVDLVHAQCKGLASKDLLIDLIEGRRIEQSVLKNLNKQQLVEIAERYRSQAVNTLINVVGLL